MRGFWRRYRKNRAAVGALAIVGALALAAVLAPALAPVPPGALSDTAVGVPGRAHLLGTDDLGRDMLSRLVYGARVSLMVGVLAASISAVIGVIVGSLAGYYGGTIDNLLMRLAELFQVVPRFFLALVVVALFGPSLFNIIFVIAILSWPPVGRLARAEFLSLREREFVEAARALGAGHASIIFRQILPNAAPPLVVITTLEIATAILLEAGLSFLGLGDPAVPSWGYMLNGAQKFLRTAWWMALFPGLGIFVTVLGFNLVGDGLNNALNPRLRQE